MFEITEWLTILCHFGILQTSNGVNSWLTRNAKPPTGIIKNSALNVSWFPS